MQTKAKKERTQSRQSFYGSLLVSDAEFGGEHDEHRYLLRRIWDKTQPHAVFVLLNPSTADGKTNDPTVWRCVKFAQSWGYGGILVLNLFAYRATNPADMLRADDPVGIKNDAYILRYTQGAGIVVAGWGKVVNHRAGMDYAKMRVNAKQRAEAVARLISCNIYCLIENLDGSPRHPLYIASDTPPKLWRNLGVPAIQPNKPSVQAALSI